MTLCYAPPHSKKESEWHRATCAQGFEACARSDPRPVRAVNDTEQRARNNSRPVRWCRLECWQDIARLKEQLKRNGVHEKIYHAKILQESEAVLALHQQLQPLRASLKSFHGLPSDLRLAKHQV